MVNDGGSSHSTSGSYTDDKPHPAQNRGQSLKDTSLGASFVDMTQRLRVTNDRRSMCQSVELSSDLNTCDPTQEARYYKTRWNQNNSLSVNRPGPSEVVTNAALSSQGQVSVPSSGSGHQSTAVTTQSSQRYQPTDLPTRTDAKTSPDNTQTSSHSAQKPTPMSTAIYSTPEALPYLTRIYKVLADLGEKVRYCMGPHNACQAA